MRRRYDYGLNSRVGLIILGNTLDAPNIAPDFLGQMAFTPKNFYFWKGQGVDASTDWARMALSEAEIMALIVAGARVKDGAIIGRMLADSIAGEGLAFEGNGDNRKLVATLSSSNRVYNTNIIDSSGPNAGVNLEINFDSATGGTVIVDAAQAERDFTIDLTSMAAGGDYYIIVHQGRVARNISFRINGGTLVNGDDVNINGTAILITSGANKNTCTRSD